jgi:hypothetical protein
VETSAKDGTGVEAAILAVTAMALEMRNEVLRSRTSSVERNPTVNQAKSRRIRQEGQGRVNLGDMYAPKQKSTCACSK